MACEKTVSAGRLLRCRCACVFQGELALTIMGIDGEITPDVMAKLSALSV